MSDLIAPVDSDGKVNISETSQKTERKSGDTLDKEDFLLLLVTQMQYQDPLEPTSNTEYVAQLAQFSELEQMQNLNSTTVNTSAIQSGWKRSFAQSDIIIRRCGRSTGNSGLCYYSEWNSLCIGKWFFI